PGPHGPRGVAVERPTPLPAPPARPAPTPRAVDDAIAPEVPTPHIAAPDADTGPIDLTPPAERTPAPEPEPDQGGPVTLRDVWRASRARRRTLHAEVRRFTVRSRRRRLAWIGAGVALIVLVAGTLGAAYSPLFAVERITVVGASALDPAELQDALADPVGTPLRPVDDSAVKEALLAVPLIEPYRLEARPPHALVLRLVERTPVGVIESEAGYTVVDAAGVALSTTSRKPGSQPLLVVEGGTETAAFESVGLVLRS